MHVLLLAAFLGAASRPPAPPAKPAFPYPIQTRTLKNGVHVTFVPMDTPGVAAYFTMFRVGSRNEVEPGRTGYAHFFEHLSFRGTEKMSGDQWESLTKTLGLDTNAFTSDDITAYWFSGPSAALVKMVEVEADRFQHLAYSEDDFKVESRAVLGEYNKDATDPDFKLDEEMRSLAFKRHTYAHTTMGFEKDVRAMPDGFKYSFDFFHRYYAPDNAWIVVAGDFDHDAVSHAIDQFYGPWQGKAATPPVKQEPMQEGERELRVDWAMPTLPRAYYAYHTPGAGDVNATAVQMVLWPYLFGKQSKLYEELVLDKRLVESIDSAFEPHRDPFLFGWELVLKSGKYEDEARKIVDHEIGALVAGRIDPQAIEDVKSHLRNALVMEVQTPYAAAGTLAMLTAAGGDADYVNELYAAIARVTPADVKEFVIHNLPLRNRTVIVLEHAPSKPARAGKKAKKGAK